MSLLHKVTQHGSVPGPMCPCQRLTEEPDHVILTADAAAHLSRRELSDSMKALISPEAFNACMACGSQAVLVQIIVTKQITLASMFLAAYPHPGDDECGRHLSL